MRKTLTIAIISALTLTSSPAWGGSAYKATQGAGSEHRQEHRHEQSQAGQYSESSTAQLIPGLEAVEQGQASLQSKQVTKLVQTCQVFSGQPLIGSAMPWCFPATSKMLSRLLVLSRLGRSEAQLMLYPVRTYGVENTNINPSVCSQNLATEGSTDKAAQSQSLLLPSFGVLQTSAGRAVISFSTGERATTPQMAAVCYSVESRILASAEKTLAKNQDTQITSRQAANALYDAGSRATFTRAMKLLAPMLKPGTHGGNSGKAKGNWHYSGACIVPVDMSQNKYWTCAGIHFDGATRTAVMGGFTLLDGNTVWGRDYKFTIAGSVSHAISSSTFSNSGKSQEINVR
jgi:hypothetical protein